MMKNYLARFTETQETEGRTFEKSLPSRVSKGSKGAFDTFEPDPDKAFSNIQPPAPCPLAREITIRGHAMPETCLLCEAGETEPLGGNLWHCPACDYRFELAAPDFDWLGALSTLSTILGIAGTVVGTIGAIKGLGAGGTNSVKVRNANDVSDILGIFNKLPIDMIGGIKPRAAGGSFNAGDTLLVGEEGRAELVRFNRSGRVYSGAQTQQMLSDDNQSGGNRKGGGNTYYVTMNVYTRDAESFSRSKDQILGDLKAALVRTGRND